MEEVVQKSWFRRNWLWFIPSMGCFTIILLLIFGVFGVFSMINNAEPIDYGLEVASNNEQVIRHIGKPIEKDGIPRGSLTFNSDSGSKIDMVVSIKGPNGEGSLTIKGTNSDGEWVFEDLYVVVYGKNKTINLLEQSLEDP